MTCTEMIYDRNEPRQTCIEWSLTDKYRNGPWIYIRKRNKRTLQDAFSICISEGIVWILMHMSTKQVAKEGVNNKYPLKYWMIVIPIDKT